MTAGSLFATLQSLGALGTLTGVGVGIAVAVPAVVLGLGNVKRAYTGVVSWFKKS